MDIGAWLRQLGLERYEEAFRESDVVPEVLPELTDEDLKELGLTIGHRRLLLRSIKELSASDVPPQTGIGPSQTAQSLSSGGAERRQLTVMFCDLVGSTALSTRLDPEDMGQVINAFHACCGDIVRQWDGHVAKLMGDGVLAYFGYPKAHENDAERAVRAGLEMAAAVSRLQAGDGTWLAVRIGIATGLAVVGDLIGDGAAKEELIVGETPNRAARLQSLAEPGAVVIGPGCRQLVGGLFEYTDLGRQPLRGFAGPVQAWRVLGESRAESHFEALRGARFTPLVGREEELSLLIARWQHAREGDGHVVLLSSEPGIGKSRLVQALRERLKGEAHTVLPHYCSPFHTNSALYPMITLLERAAGFERDDPPESQIEKLEALLAQPGSTAEDVVPILAKLLSIPTGNRYPPLNLSPKRLKQRTLEIFIDQLEILVRQEPVFALYHDVHWIDPTSLELLSMIVDRVQRLPVLVVITFRPEFRVPWTGQGHITSLSLSHLPRRHGMAMIDGITGGKPLPAAVMDQIIAKTDGVPLFLEELAKAVLESNLLKDTGDHYELAGALPAFAIPASVQDSLMARLDHLGWVKDIAQVAAVIGRRFSADLLAALAPTVEDRLREALDRLVDSGLVFRSEAAPGATYTFKHALVQEAAYHSLLKSKRQEIHGRIVEQLEKRFPETVEDEPELLAYHCTTAGLTEQAIAYWQKAGERAIERSANLEAIDHLKKGLELLQTLPDTRERAVQELALQTRLGPALIATEGYYAARDLEAAYVRAHELCRQVGENEQLFPVKRGLWTFHLVRSLRTARQLSDELCDLAEHEQNAAHLAEAHWAKGATLLFLGEFSRARAHLERAIALSDPLIHRAGAPTYGDYADELWFLGYPDPGLMQTRDASSLPRELAHPFALAYFLAYEAYALSFLGYPDRALVRSEEALVLARKLGRPFTLAYCLTFSAHLHLARRDAAMLQERADALTALASEQELDYWRAQGMIYQGWALAARGEAEVGVARIRQGLGDYRATGATIARSRQLAMLADALGKARQTEEGLSILADAVTLVDETGEAYYAAELDRLEGELFLQNGVNGDAAEVCFKNAIEVARRQEAKSWELRAATSLARLWARQGKRSQAHDLLAPVHAWFTEGFETADLRDAKALLDALS